MDKDSKNSIKVTFCKNTKKPDQVIIKDSVEALNEIKHGTWKGMIEKVNSFEYDSTDQKNYKSQLPGIAWSGIFNHRSSEGIIQHSGLICMDLDKIPDDKLSGIRDMLMKDEYTFALFRSPRMNGLKCIVRIPPEIENHQKYFEALKEYYDSPYLDGSGKDISRLCFVSFDPDLYFNPDSETWTIKKEFPEPSPEQPEEDNEGTNEKTKKQSAEIFKRLVSWELKRNNKYEDGNKHSFLVSLFSACNRFGIIIEDAISLTYEKFKDYPGTEYVKKEDFKKIANDVYYLYHEEFDTASFKEKAPNYIRVGINYFKIITKPDRYEIKRTELKPWNKEIIILDHGRGFLKNIPQYDDFIIIPDNSKIILSKDKCYNLYRVFPHIPAPGGWKWTKILLEHIFQDQYELGIRLLQIWYLHPKKITPILVLVSKIRQTGKTTFINWINMIFSGNVANITPGELTGNFNASYATSNIITIEETLFEKDISIEKLKDLATKKRILINQKNVHQFEVDFYGKIILTSNNENKFARIDEEEIRFFIRKVGIPQYIDHAIEDYLKEEIPAFLHYLTTLPPVDFSKDRTGFTPEELDNEFLQSVKDESKSWLCKELMIHFRDLFDNKIFSDDLFHADPISIKDKFYPKDNRVELAYIRKVLKEELHLEYIKESTSQRPLDSEIKKQGRFYIVRKEQFTSIRPGE